jgi:hypothetical protein
VPGEYEHSSFKKWSPCDGPQKQNCDFHDDDYDNSDSVSAKKTHRRYLQWITICALGAQRRNVDFVETGFTGQADFTIVWHSVTNRATIDFVARVTQSTSILHENESPTHLNRFFTLSSHLHLSSKFPNCSLTYIFQTKILHNFTFPPTQNYPAHPIFLDVVTVLLYYDVLLCNGR